MKKIFLISIILLFTFYQKVKSQSKHTISLNYLGQTYTHPGISVWYDYTFLTKEKTRTNRKGKTKTKYIHYKSHNRTGFYHFPKNHNGWLASTGILVQRNNKRGGLIGIALSAGSQVTFLNEDTYQINQNGNIEQTKSNNTHFLLGLNTRLGKEYFYKNKDNRWGWHLTSSIYWLRPFANTSQLLPTLELGVSYKIKSSL